MHIFFVDMANGNIAGNIRSVLLNGFPVSERRETVTITKSVGLPELLNREIERSEWTKVPFRYQPLDRERHRSGTEPEFETIFSAVEKKTNPHLPALCLDGQRKRSKQTQQRCGTVHPGL